MKQTALTEIFGNQNLTITKPSALEEVLISKSKIDQSTGNIMTTFVDVSDWSVAADIVIQKMSLMLYGPSRVFAYQEDGAFKIAEETLNDVIRRHITELVPNIRPSLTSDIVRATLDRVPLHDPQLEPSYIYYANGYFDTMTGKFTEEEFPTYNHRRIKWNFLTKEELASPEFKPAYSDYTQFLKEISEGDTEIIMQIQQMIGASLLPTKQFRKAWFMIGEGGNGKSSLVNMINRVHGAEKISSVALENLTGQRAPFNCYALVGKTVNSIDDLSNISMKENGILKTIISGDQLTAEIKGGKQFPFFNEATLIAAGNSLPNINDKGNSTAILDRMIFVPLRHKFKVNAEGVNRAKRLIEDDVIQVIATTVAYAVHAAQKNGLVIGDRSKATADTFETETDSVKYWLDSDEYMTNELHSLGFVVVDKAYTRYKGYILDAGHKPLGKITFNSSLEKHLPVEKKQKRLSGGEFVGEKKYVFEYKTGAKAIVPEDLPWAN